MADEDANSGGARTEGTLLEEFISRQEREQRGQDGALDNKFTAAISFNGAIVAIFGAASALGTVGVAGSVDWSLSVAVLALFFANGVLTVRYYAGFPWNSGPDLQRVREIDSTLSTEAAHAWALRQRLIAITENEVMIGGKRVACALSISLALADATLIGVIALVRAFPFAP